MPAAVTITDRRAAQRFHYQNSLSQWVISQYL